MAQIGRTGHINYPFKGKMRVDPIKTRYPFPLPHAKTLKAYNFLSFSIFPLRRKADILAYNSPPRSDRDERDKAHRRCERDITPISLSFSLCLVHERVRLLRGGGVMHGAEIRAMCGTWELLRLQTAAPWDFFLPKFAYTLGLVVWSQKIGPCRFNITTKEFLLPRQKLICKMDEGLDVPVIPFLRTRQCQLM
ncbi:hypothetical protein CXB51_026607 [Gossypium anomalum]|uniref:Uncharacterized protein n=1 Tax=Gossypium anomalum TaxID=47600 RepID=A0A8J6CTD2_9ROSI|nr:hypothetical protein CXB51_026607 [Gossypium anomalum]